MSVIAILIFISLTVALLFLAGFIWAVKSGQFEDTLTPSLRVLTDDETELPKDANTNKHLNQQEHITRP